MFAANMFWTGFCVACFLLLVTLVTVTSQPIDIHQDNGNSHKNTMQQLPMETSMRLIGDATSFLRSWFRKFTATLQSRQRQQQATRIKRAPGTGAEKPETPDIKVNAKESNESSFEIYEKKYIINQTLNYLKQIYYYSEYRQKMRQSSTAQPGGDGSSTSALAVPVPVETPDDSNRVNALLSDKMNELSSMSLSQLETIFHNVRRAAKNGVEDPGIASLCCPQG